MRSLRVIVARSRPLQRSVERAIRVPGLPRRKNVGGSVWGVTMVMNEADIVESTVRHFLRQGFDGLIVVDNGSTDDTADILKEIAATDARLFVGTDSMSAYHQGRKMSYLAHLAWRAGADWVVPFDADEQWFAPQVTVPEFLRACTAQVVRCATYDVYPPSPAVMTAGQPVDSTHHVTHQMDSVPSKWVKVAFRARRWVWVEMGNHGVDSRGLQISGLSLRHFRYRSYDHLLRKVRDGLKVVDEAFGEESGVASHWNYLARLTDADLQVEWAQYLCGTSSLTANEVRPRTTIRGGTPWLSWDPDGELPVAPQHRTTEASV